MAKVLLGDVVDHVKDKVDKDTTDLEFYVGGEHIDGNEITVRRKGRIEGSTIGPAFHMRFKQGDVLLMSRNPHLRKASMVDFDGICSDVSYVCRTKDNNVLLQSLLPFILQTPEFWQFAEENKKGGLPFFLNWKDFARFEFELIPIERQRQISDLLWAMERVKNAYRDLIARTDDLVKSQFIEMFGDPVDNPMGWKKLQLQQLVSEDCSISYGIVKTGEDVEGGVPVFRPVDIVGKVPTRAELKRTTHEISNQYKRSLLTGRDLLVTVRANIADTFIAGEDFKGCNVGRGIVPIRTDESKMRLEYLKAQMDFDSMNRHMKSLAKGITLIQLNMEDLRNVEFILPPTEAQDRFIEFWKQSDKSKFAAQQTLNELTDAQKALMKRIFE